MVSSPELRDRRAGEAGAQPCNGKEAELRILIKTEEIIKVQRKLTVRVDYWPQIPMFQFIIWLTGLNQLLLGSLQCSCQAPLVTLSCHIQALCVSQPVCGAFLYLRSRCREVQMFRKKTHITLSPPNTVEGLKTDRIPSGFIDRVRGKVSIVSNGRWKRLISCERLMTATAYGQMPSQFSWRAPYRQNDALHSKSLWFRDL